MKPDTNTTSTERSQAILAAMQEEMRRVVLGEMRPAGQLATLAGRGTKEIRHDLDQWAADGRILSVRHEGVDYFAMFALNPAEGYRPYPAVDDAIRILSRVLTRENAWGLASWFLGLNSFLDDQRPADLLTSDPVIGGPRRGERIEVSPRLSLGSLCVALATNRSQRQKRPGLNLEDV